MKFKAEIDVMPLPELLDPQGKAIQEALVNMGINDITDVSAGKHFAVEIHAENEDEAKKNIEAACNTFLVNPIVEEYKYTLIPIN